MMLYRFFDEIGHAAAWVSGGQIPVKPTSYYRRGERSGIWTIDEVLSRGAPGIELDQLTAISEMMDLGSGSEVYFENCVMATDAGDSVLHGRVLTFDQDGLIISMAGAISKTLMARLGKKVAVQVLDVEPLFAALDEQLGCAGKLAAVSYTRSLERDHFLKSVEDAWQVEVRALWEPTVIEERWLSIPPGIGRLVDPSAIPLEHDGSAYDHDLHDQKPRSSHLYDRTPNLIRAPTLAVRRPKPPSKLATFSGNRAARRKQAALARRADFRQ